MVKQPPPGISTIDRLVDAPVIYFDQVPNVGTRGGMMNAVLAVHVDERTSSGHAADHVVAVANLRFTMATAALLRDLLDKILLAAAVPPGQAN